MATKFYVWDGARWREVSLDGHVEGWGLVRFVVARGGRLMRVRRKGVLRGLLALAAGRVTTVRDGPPLSQIRLLDKAFNQMLPSAQKVRHVSTQCGKLDVCMQADISTVHSTSTANMRIQASELSPSSKQQKHKSCHQNSDQIRSDLNLPRKRKLEKLEDTCKSDNYNSSSVKRKRLGSDEYFEMLKAKRKHLSSPSQTATDSVSTPCKELIIEDQDLELLRRFLEHSSQRFFKVDLRKFDEDNSYKRQVLFRFNPIVHIAQNPVIHRLLCDHHTETREKECREFITMLGLRSADETSSHTAPTYRTRYMVTQKEIEARRAALTNINDKENINQQTSEQVERTKILKENDRVKTRSINKTGTEKRKQGAEKTSKEDSEILADRQEKTSEVNIGGVGDGKKEQDAKVSSSNGAKLAAGLAAVSKRSTLREYSAMEDDAIISYIQDSTRAGLVNGNRMWQELQPEHSRRTGQFRSWQSLRNHYLRYLLPRLGNHLPPIEATRLRAAAAIGNLKSRKAPARRNSIYNDVPVQSAWKPRRNQPPPTPTPPRSPSATRRSPSPAPRLAPTPTSSRPSRSPHPSIRFYRSSFEVTFTSTSSETDFTSHKRRKRKLGSQRKSPRKLRPRAVFHKASENNRTSHTHTHTLRTRTSPRKHTPTYSDVTRRFANRIDSMGTESDEILPQHSKKSRRLYNARAVL